MKRDHTEAIRKLWQAGFQATEIRDILLKQKYFRRWRKTRTEVLFFIHQRIREFASGDGEQGELATPSGSGLETSAGNSDAGTDTRHAAKHVKVSPANASVPAQSAPTLERKPPSSDLNGLTERLFSGIQAEKKKKKAFL